MSLSIITTKSDYQKRLVLKKTGWEVKTNCFLKQSENPNVYILDVGLFPNALEAAMESLVRLASEIAENNGLDNDCLNLILHKTDFENGEIVSKYNSLKEFRVPDSYVKEILENKEEFTNYFSQIKVYLFSHLGGRPITETLKVGGNFIGLYRSLERIDKTWINYWYVNQVHKILTETITGLTTEELNLCIPFIKNLKNQLRSYDDEKHVSISTIFEDICNWKDGDIKPISKDGIMYLVEKLNSVTK